ncbi:MAG TPA: hypothetical protein VIK84_01915 [Haloplasmataceae bacterium]
MSKVLIVNNNDKRMEYVKNYLKERIDVSEVNDELTFFYEMEKENNKYLILPVRGVNQHNLIDDSTIYLTENYLNLWNGKTIYTGLISETLKKQCNERGIRLVSYLSEEMAIKNNYITTEGIIEAMVNNSEKAIFNSQILIIGYGKLGQICGKVLKALKGNITISCRHEKDILNAKINEFKVITHPQIISCINQFDFIINTVPYRLLNHTILRKINKSCQVIIDVSSKPYGLDHDYANKIGVRVLLLPGIPGKIAPITAGEIIGEYIYRDIIGGEV